MQEKADLERDWMFFVMGASMSSGSRFWSGKQGSTNKGLIEEYSKSVSPDGEVLRIKKVTYGG